MRRTDRPALARAIGHVRLVVGSCRQSGKTRLPTAAALARQCGVSKNTLLAALAEVVAEEGLTLRRGSGIWIGPAPTPPEPSSEPAIPQWQRIAGAIARDIELGAYTTAGYLPTAKQLWVRYGGCHQTLRKALVDLEARGTIVRRASRYHLPTPLLTHTSGSVVLVAARDRKRAVLPDLERSQQMYRGLCHECARHGVNLIPYMYDSWEDSLIDASARGVVSEKEIASRHTVLGYVFRNAGMPRPENYTLLLQRLLYLERPVVVIDEVGEVDFRTRLTAASRLLVVSVANSGHSGESMGRYLLARGHRRAAYLSHLHHLRWSQNRLNGLRTVIAGAGGRLEACVSSQSGYDDPYDRRMHEQVVSRYAQPLETFVSRLLETAPQPERAVDRLRWAVFDMAREDLTREILTPLFQQALGAEATTAWVCANDETAFAALSFLSTLPKQNRIAVVGFDDSTEALLKRLTSYNFDIPQAAHLALHHILYGVSGRSAQPQAETREVGGFVVQRETC